VEIEPEAETHALYIHIRDARPLSEMLTSAPPAPPNGYQLKLATIIERLQDPACRLLTLVGPAGSGKNNLAAQAAAEQRHAFRDGVMFVSRPLVAALPQALGLALDNGGTSRSRHKQVLLALDVSESGVSREWLRQVLQTAPQAKILLTSAQALRLPGECVLQIEGLETLPAPC
jgi:predicted ATPase